MAGANREAEKPTAERPIGSEIGTRPFGLAGGFGFHPDTIVRDTNTPKPSGDQPDLLTRYRLGFFSLINPFIDGEFSSPTGDSQTPAISSETPHTERRIIERGLEMVGLPTTGMLVPKVTEAFISLREEGASAVTATQLRRRMNECHPARGLFPMGKGDLPRALRRMERDEKVKSNDVEHEDETGVRKITVYTMTEQPRQPQAETS